MSGLRICGTGHYAPDRIVTNRDLAARVDTSDEWITTRTGIRERRHCDEQQNIDLAAEAARRAMADAGINPLDIGAVVVATFTPDMICPPMACHLQKLLGLRTELIAFDVNAACTGFLFALDAAYGLLCGGRGKYALVVGSEYISRIIDWENRSTCVLFGDGAGAVVVALDETRPYVCVTGVETDTDILRVGGQAAERVCVEMNGNAVFRFAVSAVPRCIGDVLQKAGLTLRDIDWFVMHQANRRIIDHVAKSVGIPPEKLYCNIDRYGNTSAASIPIALDELRAAGPIRPGQRVLLVGFGGGLTWGGSILSF